jgi:two-component system chemotaxis response regulator CheB
MNFSNSKYIIIGGSAGSFRVITRLLSELPEDFPLPIILCLHRLKHIRTGFVEALQLKSKIKVKEPFDKENIRKGNIYLAPANYHLLIELGNTFSLSVSPYLNHSRPSIDLSFESAADTFKSKLIGILLSGANKDGANGIKSVKNNGGITVVQKPSECQSPTMTKAAIETGKVDLEYGIDEIAQLFNQIYKQKAI